MAEGHDLDDVEDMVALCQSNVDDIKEKSVSPESAIDVAVSSAASVAEHWQNAIAHGRAQESNSAAHCEKDTILTGNVVGVAKPAARLSAAGRWQTILGCEQPQADQSTHTTVPDHPPCDLTKLATGSVEAFCFEWPPWFANGQSADIEELKRTGILPRTVDSTSQTFLLTWLKRSHAFRSEVHNLCDSALRLLGADNTCFFLTLQKLRDVSSAVDQGLTNAVRTLPPKHGLIVTQANFEDIVCFAPTPELSDFAVRDLRDMRLLLNRAFSTLLHKCSTQSFHSLTKDQTQLLDWLKTSFDRATQLSTRSATRFVKFKDPPWKHVQLAYSAYLTTDLTLRSFCGSWLVFSLAFRTEYSRNLDVPALRKLLAVLGDTVRIFLDRSKEGPRQAPVASQPEARALNGLFRLVSGNIFFNLRSKSKVKSFCIRDAVELISELLATLASKEEADWGDQHDLVHSVRRTQIVVQLLLDGELDDTLVIELCETLANICGQNRQESVSTCPSTTVKQLVREWPACFPEGKLKEYPEVQLDVSLVSVSDGDRLLINDWLATSYVWHCKLFKLTEELARLDINSMTSYDEACCYVLLRKLRTVSAALGDALLRFTERSDDSNATETGASFVSKTARIQKTIWADFVQKDLSDMVKIAVVVKRFASHLMRKAKFGDNASSITEMLDEFDGNESAKDLVECPCLKFKVVPKPMFQDPHWKFIAPKFVAYILGENGTDSVNGHWLAAYLKDSIRFRDLYQRLALNVLSEVPDLYGILLRAVKAKKLSTEGVIGFGVVNRSDLVLDSVVPEDLLRFVAADIKSVVSDVSYAVEVLVTNLSESTEIGSQSGATLFEKLEKINWIPEMARLSKLYGAELRDIHFETDAAINVLEASVLGSGNVDAYQALASTMAAKYQQRARECDLTTPEIDLNESDTSSSTIKTPDTVKQERAPLSNRKPVVSVAPMQRGKQKSTSGDTPSDATVDSASLEVVGRSMVEIFRFTWPEWCDAEGNVVTASLTRHVKSVLQSVAKIASTSEIETSTNEKLLLKWFQRVTEFRKEYRGLANGVLLALQSEPSEMRKTCLELLVDKLAKMFNSVNKSVWQCNQLLVRGNHAVDTDDMDIFQTLSDCVATGYFDKCFQDFCQMKNELLVLCRDLTAVLRQDDEESNSDAHQKLSMSLAGAPESKAILDKCSEPFDLLTNPPWALADIVLVAEHFIGPDAPIGLALVTDSLLNNWKTASMDLRKDLQKFLRKTRSTKVEKLRWFHESIQRLTDLCAVVKRLQELPLLQDCEAAPGELLERIFLNKGSLTDLACMMPHVQVKIMCMDDMKHAISILAKIILRFLISDLKPRLSSAELDKIRRECDLSEYESIPKVLPITEYLRLDSVPADRIPRDLGSTSGGYIARSSLQETPSKRRSSPEVVPMCIDSPSPSSSPAYMSRSEQPALSISANIPVGSPVGFNQVPFCPPVPTSFVELSSFTQPPWNQYHTSQAGPFRPIVPGMTPPIPPPRLPPPLPPGEAPVPPPPPKPESPAPARQPNSSPSDLKTIPTPGSSRVGSIRGATPNANPDDRSPGKLLSRFVNLIDRYGQNKDVAVTEPNRRTSDSAGTTQVQKSPLHSHSRGGSDLKALVARLEQRLESAKRKAPARDHDASIASTSTATLPLSDASASKRFKSSQAEKPNLQLQPDEHLLEKELRLMDLEVKREREKVAEHDDSFRQIRNMFEPVSVNLDTRISNFETKHDAAEKKLIDWKNTRDQLNDLREDYFRLQGNLDELSIQKKLRREYIQRLTAENQKLKSRRAVYRDLAISCQAKVADHGEPLLHEVADELDAQCKQLEEASEGWFTDGHENKPLLLLIQNKLEDWLQQERTYDPNLARAKAYAEQLEFMIEKLNKGKIK